MKSLEQAIELAKSDEQSFLDPRLMVRLNQFLKSEQIVEIGMFEFSNEDSKNDHDKKVLEFTEENVLKQLERDVAFGFEKALDKRGISTSLMFHVIKGWNEILENDLSDFSDDNYAQYGLPLFKATALLYGFDNPIGDDVGDELKYSLD